MTVEQLIHQPFDYLQTLKTNPIKYKCLDVLFGLESEISINDIINIKENFEDWFINFGNYDEFKNWIIPRYKKYNITEIFIVDNIELDEKNMLNISGSLTTGINYKIKWYDYLEFTII